MSDTCYCTGMPHDDWSKWVNLPAYSLRKPLLPFLMTSNRAIMLPQFRVCFKCGREITTELELCVVDEVSADRQLTLINKTRCLTNGEADPQETDGLPQR